MVWRLWILLFFIAGVLPHGVSTPAGAARVRFSAVNQTEPYLQLLFICHLS